MHETLLSLNMEFRNNRTKVNLSGPIEGHIPKEVKQPPGRVDKKRKQLGILALVRIMKAQKIRKLSELIQKVSSNLFNLFILTLLIKCN